MSWFKRENNEIEATAEKRVRTEGLWVKCDDCRQVIWKKDLDANWNVCTKCERHFRIDSHERLALLLDGGEPGTDRDDFYKVFDFNLQSTDPLKFTDTRAYKDRLRQTQASTGLKDAVVNAEGKLNGRDVIVSAMEYSFIGGGLGAGGGGAGSRAGESGTEERKTVSLSSAS